MPSVSTNAAADLGHCCSPPQDRERGTSAASPVRKLHAARDILANAGLRPVVDEQLCRVLSDCPVCRIGDHDPLGLHRPLVVGCWSARPEDPVRPRCSTGCSPAAIREALRTIPVMRVAA